MDTIHDGIMIVDKSVLIVSVNKAFEEITGYRGEEVTGKRCSILKCTACEATRGKKGDQWCALFKKGT